MNITLLLLLNNESNLVGNVATSNDTSIGFLENLGVGILSSVLASILIGFTLILFSRKARWLITAILARLAHHDIDFVFKNKEDAKKSIIDAISGSKKVYILTSRGNEFQTTTYQNLFSQGLLSNNVDFKIIMPDPENKQNEYDFILQRENEMRNLDPGIQLKKSISANIEYLKSKGVNFKTVKMPHFVKIVITDDWLFLEPYNKHRLGHEDPVMKYRVGDTYRCFSRYFGILWDSCEANAQ